MAQVAAVRRQSSGDTIDYTPGSAVTAGDVVVVGNIVGVAESSIAASVQGSLSIGGVWRLPKITGAITAGQKLYWDPAGDPVSGDSSSGAITATAGSLKVAGYAVAAQASGDETVDVVLARA